MSKVNKYLAEWKIEEIAREERLHKRRIQTAMNKLRRVLNIENERGEISAITRKKHIMNAVEWFDRTHIKLTIVNLYRRYRRVRIQALTECIAIASSSNSQQETIEEIRKLIIETGEAHKASQEREKEQCAAS